MSGSTKASNTRSTGLRMSMPVSVTGACVSRRSSMVAPVFCRDGTGSGWPAASTIMDADSSMKVSSAHGFVPLVTSTRARGSCPGAAHGSRPDPRRARREVPRQPLDDLAGRAGESSATAVVLEKIATGLGVPLGAPLRRRDVLAEPGVPARTTGCHGATRSPATSGATSRRRVASPIRYRGGRVPAGAAVAYETGAAMCDPPADLGAGGEARGDGRPGTHRLSEGDCLAMRVDRPTTFRNRTRRAARYVVVIATSCARPRRGRCRERSGSATL